MFREYDNIQAARGCNQYKHVPGCPDAGQSGDNKSFDAKSAVEKGFTIWKNLENEDKKYEPGTAESRALRDKALDARNYYSNMRAAMNYIEDNPNGDRVQEAKDDIAKNFEKMKALQTIGKAPSIKTKQKLTPDDIREWSNRINMEKYELQKKKHQIGKEAYDKRMNELDEDLERWMEAMIKVHGV